MLYHVRFEYGRNVQASSKDEALQKICKLMKDNPETFIRDVREPSTVHNQRPVWKRLLTGR